MNISRSHLTIFAALLSVAACGAPPPPRTGGATTSGPSAAGATPPAMTPGAALTAPPPVASARPTAAPPPDPPTIIIHEAELYGELHAHAGKTATIATRVITTKIEPEIGNKGVLFQRLNDSNNDVWVPIADVVVKSKLDKQSRITVTITAEKKEFPAGQKVVPLAPKSRMRLKWEWQ
jgi:hypothetical protein